MEVSEESFNQDIEDRAYEIIDDLRKEGYPCDVQLKIIIDAVAIFIAANAHAEDAADVNAKSELVLKALAGRARWFFNEVREGRR